MRFSDWSSDLLSAVLADQPVALQQREDVVAVLALRRRHEDLDAVVEAEQALGALAVAAQRVEGAEHAQPLRRLGQAGARIVVRDDAGRERKSVVWGKSVSVRVDHGGSGSIKKKNKHGNRTEKKT